jgi:hypothetical protein
LFWKIKSNIYKELLKTEALFLYLLPIIQRKKNNPEKLDYFYLGSAV